MINPEAPVDLHLHSYYSDGRLSPEELVRVAAEVGLAAVSVADHDTIAGQKEAISAGSRYGVEVIPGIEFSIDEEEADIHILGYLFDPDDLRLVECSKSLERSRRERIRSIAGRLTGLGIDIGFDEVMALSGRGTVGRLHVARILLDKGLIGDIQEAFWKYLGKGRPAFVPRESLSVEEVTAVIHGAGGVSVWAHPGAGIRNEGLVDRMLSAGIGGFESVHPNHSSEISAAIESEAERLGLVVTGGSDFHFDEAMKAGIGEISADYSSVIALKARARGHLT